MTNSVFHKNKVFEDFGGKTRTCGAQKKNVPQKKAVTSKSNEKSFVSVKLWVEAMESQSAIR